MFLRKFNLYGTKNISFTLCYSNQSKKIVKSYEWFFFCLWSFIETKMLIEAFLSCHNRTQIFESNQKRVVQWSTNGHAREVLSLLLLLFRKISLFWPHLSLCLLLCGLIFLHLIVGCKKWLFDFEWSLYFWKCKIDLVCDYVGGYRTQNHGTHAFALIICKQTVDF